MISGVFQIFFVSLHESAISGRSYDIAAACRRERRLYQFDSSRCCDRSDTNRNPDWLRIVKILLKGPRSSRRDVDDGQIANKIFAYTQVAERQQYNDEPPIRSVFAISVKVEEL
jgi:hypothetical protein